MSIHQATVDWKREGDFERKKYLRTHVWRFDGGVEVRAAAAPSVVPKPWTVDDAVDPEEAFVASVSSCHMLTFLFLAANDGFVAESYCDEAEGLLEREGTYQSLTKITLRPRIVFSGPKQPSPSQLEDLHRRAHEECFIARSVKTDIRIESTPA
jgi:organic hydroperoxide reductase OsmC/OhrA